MRPHERPPRIWPVLVAALAGVIILTLLGIWQVQRLHWKEGLLAQLAAKSSAEPVGLDAVEAMAGKGEDPEFVRVRFNATYRHDAWKKMISTYEGGQGWTIITPAVTTDDYAVIVDRGRVPGQRLESFDSPPGELELTGLVRTYRSGKAYFDPENDPAANLWFWWDVPGMLQASGLDPALKPFPYVVQLLPGTVTAEFPKPPEPTANLRNNHLGYAITWFGLAVTLAVVALVYIRGLRIARA